MPIRGEYVVNFTNLTGAIVTSNILARMVPINIDYSNDLVYIPNAQFKYIDFVSDNELRNIGIEVVYRDKDGLLYPFRIVNGETVNLELLFEELAF